MVTCDEDSRESRLDARLEQFRQLAYDSRKRLGAGFVEDVASDQENVHCFAIDDRTDLLQPSELIRKPILGAKTISQMPVAGMQDSDQRTSSYARAATRCGPVDRAGPSGMNEGG